MSNYPKVSQEDVDAFILHETYTVLPDGRTTVCQLTLKNNFTVEGTSACVSIQNFDAVKGNAFARERAVTKVWEHLGFDLSSKVSLINGAGEATGDITKVGNALTYVGTKVVRAVPYKLGEYNTLRGWDIPEDQDPQADGYLIEYVDGGPANVHGFTGYISWSPKDVFERSYTIGVAAHVTTFVDRLRTEYSQLSERVKKASAFVGSNVFNTLDHDEQEDLIAQVDYMKRYQGVLGKRIKRHS